MRIGLAVASLCVLAGELRAAPLAKASEDVDGDGTPEELALAADGTLSIGGVTRARLRLAAAPTTARLAVGKTGTVPMIVVDVSTATTEEAIVISTRGWTEVTRFPLGGVGLDREYGFAVDATPTGIYRYQVRTDVRRCDGKPSYLFAERLETAGFRPATPPSNLPTSMTTLPARLDPSTTVAAPLVFQARAASHQPGATDAGGLAIPHELDDGQPDTVWREDLPTAGEGQFFTFTSRVESARAQALRIVPGNPASRASKTFNRPRVIAIVTAHHSWRVELPDAASGAAYVIDLPEPVTECLTVMLESSYGRPQGTTAIAELEVFADGEREGGGEVWLARVVAEGKSGTVNAVAALAKRGAAAATAIDAELAKTADAGARRRLVVALAKIDDPAAAPALVNAATSGWVRDKDLVDVIVALGQRKQVAALRDLAARGGLPVEIRIAAATQLLPIGTGYDALVDLAGKGPREVRRAVIERLALAAAATLAQTAQAQTRAAAAGDVWRALTRRARGHDGDRALAVTAMTAALASATDYERRYRLIEGVAAYGDAPALRALGQLLATLATSAESAALRQIAVNAIASSPRAEATELVLALARDADPGVRLAALSALAGAETDPSNAWHTADGPDGIDRVIINGLTVDTWPEVRRRAATALGARCQRPGPAAALADAVGRDPAVDVRADALTALVQCQARGIAALLAKTWDDGKAPLELRERAVTLAVMLGDPLLGQTLVGKFSAWRGEALTSAPALRLAQAAAAAIGRLDANGAADVLIDALDDPAFPEIVGAAALGLGALGPACPTKAKAKLLVIARGDQAQAAAAARHAAARCGRSGAERGRKP